MTTLQCQGWVLELLAYWTHSIKSNFGIFRRIYRKTSSRLSSFEFAKSRAMRAIRAKVSNACQLLIFTCQRANVAKAWQFFNLACQRAKACQYFNLACQRAKRRAIFSTWLAKRCANFSTIFQKNYVFLYT